MDSRLDYPNYHCYNYITTLFNLRGDIMARMTNIERLQNITYDELSKMNLKELRRFTQLSSKSVYDKFRATEKYLQQNPNIHSAYVDPRMKGGTREKYRPRRINASSLNKMNRRTLMQEIENLKQSSTAKTLTIKGSIEYTKKLEQMGVTYEEITSITDKDIWEDLRKAMEIYGSNSVIHAYNETGSIDEMYDELDGTKSDFLNQNYDVEDTDLPF